MTCKCCAGEGGWYQNDGHNQPEWVHCPRYCTSKEAQAKETYATVTNLMKWKAEHGR